jgi:flagellar hook-associated protein 3 FlgL
MISERFIVSDELKTTLAAAQAQAAIGRLLDTPAFRGFEPGSVICLRQEHARLQAIIDTNKRVVSRLGAAQAIVDNLAGAASTYAGAVAELNSGQARTLLAAFTAALNSEVSGAHLFSGINTDVRPIASYFEQQSPARQAVAEAFLAAFGVAQMNEGVNSIEPGDMQAFLSTVFTSLFEVAAWRMHWSAASGENARSRISHQELIETSVNANENGFRQLACAYTMTADLPLEALQPDTAAVLRATAARMASNAAESLTALSACLAGIHERVQNANEMIAVQMMLMASHIGVLEAMESDEVTARVARLREQLQKAYALTAQAQKLGHLKTR